MSYLSMTNVFLKTQHRFLQDSPTTTTTTAAATTPTTIPQSRHLLSSNNNKNNEKIQQVWSRYNFDTNTIDNSLNDKYKMSWTISCNNNNNNNNNDDKLKKIEEPENETIDKDIIPPPSSVSPVNNDEKDEQSITLSPSHHARRPPNAFLIFCKKHRPIVRSKYPNLENRGVTKILGEWWALLDDNDKAPYTQLAKEYKDAFLSANPDFKWYKLPAPPLRTLNVRPINSNNNGCNVNKVPSPISSPVPTNLHTESEFTPGKLADESQLGNLTALMMNNNNNNYTTITPKSTIINENNNNIETSPVNLIRPHLPPIAPIKKRISQTYSDNKSISRNLLDNISGGEFCNNNNNNNDNQIDNNHNDNNMTNQELMNKVVDKIFTNNSDDIDNYQCENNNQAVGLKYSKEIRKSGRQCKGKRYEKFMSEGRLLGVKRDLKPSTNRNNIDNNDDIEIEIPNLDHTIKRLAERTKLKSLLTEFTTSEQNETNDDNSATTITTQTKTNDFNLDLKISMLPSLSYEVYSQRKKDNKKRKNRIRTNNNNHDNGVKIPKIVKNEQPVGSRKRKNKNSITHLENKQQPPHDNNDLLLGLATLAEVAANTQKIDEEVPQ